MKGILYFNLAVVLSATPAAADVYSALQGVYDTSPVISEARAAVGVADSELAAARTETKPYLGISANAGVARTKFFDQTFDTTPTEIGATFQQNVFQGFSTMAKIKGAKGIVAARQASLYATQQQVFLDAINAYINVLNADEVWNLKKNRPPEQSYAEHGINRCKHQACA